MPTYDPQRVVFTFADSIIGGFSSGSMVKAMRNQDGYSLTIGAQGDGARVRNADRSGRFEVTLRSDSPSNDFLQAMALADEAFGLGLGPAQLKDTNGTAIAAAQNAWIVKIPDLDRQKELGEVTWIIETDFMELAQGGIYAP